VQIELLKNKKSILSKAQKIFDSTEKLVQSHDFKFSGKKYPVIYTSEQKHQVKNPLSVVEV